MFSSLEPLSNSLTAVVPENLHALTPLKFKNNDKINNRNYSNSSLKQTLDQQYSGRELEGFLALVRNSEVLHPTQQISP